MEKQEDLSGGGPGPGIHLPAAAGFRHQQAGAVAPGNGGGGIPAAAIHHHYLKIRRQPVQGGGQMFLFVQGGDDNGERLLHGSRLRQEVGKRARSAGRSTSASRGSKNASIST